MSLRLKARPITNGGSSSGWTVARGIPSKTGILVGTIATVTPYLYSRAGRVDKIRILHSDGRGDSAGQDFRKAIGYNIIPSTQFEIEAQGRTWSLPGAASGHAVGLCQWGAKELADKGYRYDTILRYYFPGTTLQHAASQHVAHSVMLLSDEMQLSQFDFPFDPTLIADRPIEPRDQARLLVLSRRDRPSSIAALPICRCPTDRRPARRQRYESSSRTSHGSTETGRRKG